MAVRGMETVDALRRYRERIQCNNRGQLHQLTVALDFSNAFHSGWRPYLARQLAGYEIGTRLNSILCENFLDERGVMSGNVEAEMPKGCPQGSSIGPTLWNVLMEGWFA